MVGRPDTTDTGFGSLSSDDRLFALDQHPFYGLSPTFVVASTDDDLIGLELQHRDGAVIALSPTFASGTTDYTASVVNGVDVVTVIPTVSHSHATYEITDGSGTALDDADLDADRFQVALPDMANTIMVVVTTRARQFEQILPILLGSVALEGESKEVERALTRRAPFVQVSPGPAAGRFSGPDCQHTR